MKDYSVVVSETGGSIVEATYQGRPFMGPARREVIAGESKRRGWSQWCQPWGRGEQAEARWRPTVQHGHLRDSLMETTHVSESLVTLKLASEHDSLHYEVCVEITDEGILTSLLVENRGKASVPILPAHHPYFPVSYTGMVEVHDDQWNLVGTCYSSHHIKPDIPVGEMTIVKAREYLSVTMMDDMRVEIDHLASGLDCKRYAIWSDQPTKYVCVEPLFADPAKYATDQGLWLHEREARRFIVLYRLTPLK